jgi:hypothetical protein
MFKSIRACGIRNNYGAQQNKMQLATRKMNIRYYCFKIFTKKHKLVVKFRGYALRRSMQSLIAELRNFSSLVSAITH